ncbi:hypothetical protein, partial [Mycobacterium tuberculosis]
MFPMLTTGCLSESKDDGTVTLKIMSVYDQASLYNLGLRKFLNEHPDISVEWIEPLDDGANAWNKYGKLEELFEEEQPDIMINDALSFRVLAVQNKYLDLSAMIETEDSWMKERYAGVDQWMKRNGDGSLAGLAPYYGSSVLLYNADQFGLLNIPPPAEPISWEEVVR